MSVFNVGSQVKVIGEETTDGIYFRVDEDTWWDMRTKNQGICHQDLLQYLEENPGVGIMVTSVELDS